MRSVLLIIILFFTSIDLNAQVGPVFNKFKGRKDRTNVVMIGAKGGVIIPKVTYNSTIFNEIPQELLLKPAFGLYIDIPLSRKVSFSPEVLYTSRGVNHADFIYREIYDASYVLMANYVDLRLPLSYRFRLSNFIQPYFFIAADLAFCLNATADYMINYEANLIDIHDELLLPDDYKSFDISALLGLGFRFNFNINRSVITTKIEVAYNFGMIDTYGTETANVVDPELSRYNRPIECMFSIGIPLKRSQKDACSTQW